jgi:branched-subunit amino acid ABC-type transport system permease component
VALTRRGRLTVTLSVTALLVVALVLLLTRTRLGSAVASGRRRPAC